MKAKLAEQLLAVLLRDRAGLTDGQLLECFIARRDDAAFEALVRRHGPMVLAVCRRVLRNYHDSEDAFQATFLVLARKAASVMPRQAVGNWLYGVAYRTALKAKATTARRRERQVVEMPEPELHQEDGPADLQHLLDKELNSLPDKYRTPLILCGLEGRSEKEAAGQLGLPQGTLSSRLSRARAMLAKRLARRGVALSLPAASARVPTALLDSTIKAACQFAAGQAATTGLISTEAAALTKGVLDAMFLSQIKVTMAIFLVAVAIVGGAGVLVSRASGPARSPDAQQKVAPSSRELPIDTMVTVAAADEIATAYQTNAALADEKFTGKRVRVTGKMLRIRGSRLGSSTVAPQNVKRTPGARIYYLEMLAAGAGTFLRFQFAKESQNQLAKLKVGQQVSVEGELLEPSESSGRIQLIEFRNCKVIDNKED
jgi:RNA polymerase sigma factor (sigma-70 family)